MSEMTVYEYEGYSKSHPEDLERFDSSYRLLVSAGIGIERVTCTAAEDLPPGEAFDEVSEKGIEALPICTYNGVIIASGAYPSDQDLADFLDVPDGVLSVDRQKPPSMGNDLPPACACGNKTR